MEEISGDLSKKLILDKKDMGPGALQRTATFINGLISELEGNNDFSRLREVPVSYSQPYEAAQRKHPRQIAAVIGLFQPDIGTASHGFVDPGSSVILTKRSDDNSWGAGTWSIPMGKIEQKDMEPGDTLGNVVLKAARREVEEELNRDRSEGFSLIVNSFIDEATGNLVHVVVEEIGDRVQRNDKVSEVALPDLREHSDVRWAKLRDIPSFDPMASGTKFVFLTALKFIQQQNTHSIASGRYT